MACWKVRTYTEILKWWKFLFDNIHPIFSYFGTAQEQFLDDRNSIDSYVLLFWFGCFGVFFLYIYFFSAEIFRCFVSFSLWSFVFEVYRGGSLRAKWRRKKRLIYSYFMNGVVVVVDFFYFNEQHMDENTKMSRLNISNLSESNFSFN